MQKIIPFLLLFTFWMVSSACSSGNEDTQIPEIDQVQQEQIQPHQESEVKKESPLLSITLAPSPKRSLLPDLKRQTATRLPERVAPNNTMSHIPQIEEIPNYIYKAILSDAVEKSGLEHDAVQVLRAEAVIWNDGSLGCPKPGEIYTLSTVNGFWIVLEIGEQEYDYRAVESGYFLVCEGNTFPSPDKGTPDS
jgi:hypothetical protein